MSERKEYRYQRDISFHSSAFMKVSSRQGFSSAYGAYVACGMTPSHFLTFVETCVCAFYIVSFYAKLFFQFGCQWILITQMFFQVDTGDRRVGMPQRLLNVGQFRVHAVHPDSQRMTRRVCLRCAQVGFTDVRERACSY